ncbi:MAG: hypothetical protein GWN84_04365 [Gammaproteobacteria bacterium]|nr:hypothetical protein [Gammaproteobacteria bacterium]NIR82231.1 hypothetical protein [Gammaproteobacteria bacterium]NIR90830.1 hypothetical protein [Gammaproteobacteria bacterium]NIU03381.1 hypothetical protein [Gammaproteobacteria bacterium]NIV50877.1 hypothetical protein [Gammaproteobacteria bacterium]
MKPRRNLRKSQLRECLAQEAARLMVEDGVRDFGTAKRKAAQQLRAEDARQLPRNDEIERAMQEYQRLFRADRQPHRLRELREMALRAMRFLAPFEPCLVGPVLRGTADEHSEVTLHLFADPPEEVNLFLVDHRIPCEMGEKRLRVSADEFRAYPSYRFVAEGVPIELVVFPHNGRRQPPLSPVDGKPMRRLSLAKFEALGGELD